MNADVETFRKDITRYLKENDRLPENYLSMLLKYSVIELLQQPQFRRLKSAFDARNCKEIIKTLTDLNDIKNKNDKCSYFNENKFMDDIGRLVQICKINHSRHPNIIEMIQNFHKKCKMDIKTIKSCADCYIKALTAETDEWFTQTCSKPHILLWVKIVGYPYWPAKVMLVEEDAVSVRFFGSLDKAVVSPQQCLLFSRESANIEVKKRQKPKLNKSIEDVNIYIKNLTIKFGAFNYAKLRTPFMVQKISQHIDVKVETDDKSSIKRSHLAMDNDDLPTVLSKRIKMEPYPFLDVEGNMFEGLSKTSVSTNIITSDNGAILCSNKDQYLSEDEINLLQNEKNDLETLNLKKIFKEILIQIREQYA